MQEKFTHLPQLLYLSKPLLDLLALLFVSEHLEQYLDECEAGSLHSLSNIDRRRNDRVKPSDLA